MRGAHWLVAYGWSVRGVALGAVIVGGVRLGVRGADASKRRAGWERADDARWLLREKEEPKDSAREMLGRVRVRLGKEDQGRRPEGKSAGEDGCNGVTGRIENPNDQERVDATPSSR